FRRAGTAAIVIVGEQGVLLAKPLLEEPAVIRGGPAVLRRIIEGHDGLDGRVDLAQGRGRLFNAGSAQDVHVREPDGRGSVEGHRRPLAANCVVGRRRLHDVVQSDFHAVDLFTVADGFRNRLEVTGVEGVLRRYLKVLDDGRQAVLFGSQRGRREQFFVVGKTFDSYVVLRELFVKGGSCFLKPVEAVVGEGKPRDDVDRLILRRYRRCKHETH